MAKRSKQRALQPTVVVASPRLLEQKPLESSAHEEWDIAGHITYWPSLRANLLLVITTIACLVPFSGRAFHVDDTLFVWAAQQIQRHPFNPYGFQLIWDVTRAPMANVTQNPPLSSYYTALIATALGWSERALHSGFILVAIALVLGTYRLARSFTRSPLLAALATLLTPGVLVSAGGVMCDTMMLALWIWATVFWIEGLRKEKFYFLVAAGVLIAASALTKYFGISLIPLLLIYAVARRRRAGMYLLCLAIPVVVLFAYQIWTAGLYGHGLLFGAAEFAASQRAATKGSPIAMAIVGLSFTGGCCLLGWTFGALIWPRVQVLIAEILSGLATVAVLLGWVDMGLQIGGGPAERFHLLTGGQLILCVAGGISVLGLAIQNVWKNRDADSVFLFLWIAGTFLFAAFVNYTVNARSVLPMIPAAGILLARHLDELRSTKGRGLDTYIAIILLASGAFSLWIAAGDSSLANSAHAAATAAFEKTHGIGGTLWFEGHWGFQYYMESLGAEPLDFGNPQLKPGDFVVIPENNIQLQDIPPQYVGSREALEYPQNFGTTTISHDLGAGFYSSYWGPLPYAIGPVAPERYWIIRLTNPPTHQPQ